MNQERLKKEKKLISLMLLKLCIFWLNLGLYFSNMKNLKITLFAGGSGNSRLINIISKIKNIDIKIIVNCYDDGKSTGRLRELVDGMLGPSDVRKNLSSLLDDNDSFEKKLKFINDYRFKKIKLTNIIKLIRKEHVELNNIINSLPKKINEDIYNFF